MKRAVSAFLRGILQTKGPRSLSLGNDATGVAGNVGYCTKLMCQRVTDRN